MNKTNHPGRVSLATKLRRVAWNIVAALLFRPFVTGLFRRWRIFLLRLFGAQVSYGANVYASARIWAPWLLEMERGACLGPDVVCYNQDRVVLREGAIVSQYAYLCTAGHDTDHANTAHEGLVTAPITLERGAWIGTRAFLGMGVEIGQDAIVGATASVYKDVEPGAVVGGNPAKVLKMRTIKVIGGGKFRPQILDSGFPTEQPIVNRLSLIGNHKERRVA